MGINPGTLRALARGWQAGLDWHGGLLGRVGVDQRCARIHAEVNATVRSALRRHHTSPRVVLRGRRVRLQATASHAYICTPARTHAEKHLTRPCVPTHPCVHARSVGSSDARAYSCVCVRAHARACVCRCVKVPECEWEAQDQSNLRPACQGRRRPSDGTYPDFNC